MDDRTVYVVRVCPACPGCPTRRPGKERTSVSRQQELLPKDVTHGWMERVFSKCGTVVYVSVPRYKSSGDPKGFAFVEFEKEEEAREAIQVRKRPIRAGADPLQETHGLFLQTLNNPPEDAPRKAGIFPRTRCGKPVHLPGEEEEEEEEKKKRKKKKKKESSAAKEQPKEAEKPAPKRRRSTAEAGPGGKTARKVSEKKRRRSQTTDESENDVPAKMRKTRASQDVTETSEWPKLRVPDARAQVPAHRKNTRCLQVPSFRGRKTAERTETRTKRRPRGKERRSTERS